MTLTKEKIQSIEKDLRKALDSVAAYHGISMSKGAISYNGATFSCKISGSVVTRDTPKVESPAAGSSLIGRKFKNGGNNVYTIIAMKNSDTVELQTQRGTRYSGSVASLDKVMWVK